MKNIFLKILALGMLYSLSVRSQNQAVSSFYDLMGAFYQTHPIDTGPRLGSLKEVDRLNLLWADRLYPDGLPGPAATAYIDYAGNYTPVTTSHKWNSIGRTEHTKAGQIHRILFAPGYNGTSNKQLFATSFFGGLWKSDNDGQSWNVLNTDLQLPITSVSDVAVDYQNPNNIFISTGYGDNPSFDYYSPNWSDVAPIFTTGIYRSTNGGTSWHPMNNGLISHFTGGGVTRRMIVNPIDANYLYVATTKGIFRTSNALSQSPSWTRIALQTNSQYDRELRGLEFMPGDPSTVYASGKDIYKSTDGGITWTTITGSSYGLNLSSLGSFTVQRINIAVTPADPSRVYAHISGNINNSTAYKLYMFKNGVWSLLREETVYTSMHWLGIAASPFIADEVLIGVADNYWNMNPAGNIRGIRNFDNSNGMPIQALGFHADIHAIVYNPIDTNLFLTADHGGIASFNINRNVGWSASLLTGLNNGLITEIIWSFDDGIKSNELMIVGKQCTGLWYRGAGSQNWHEIEGKTDGYGAQIYNENTTHFFWNRNWGLGASQLWSGRNGNYAWEDATREYLHRPAEDGCHNGKTKTFGSFKIRNNPHTGKKVFGFTELYTRLLDIPSTPSNTWARESDMRNTAALPGFQAPPYSPYSWCDGRMIKQFALSNTDANFAWILTGGSYTHAGISPHGEYVPGLFKTGLLSNGANTGLVNVVQNIWPTLPASANNVLYVPVITDFTIDPSDHNRIWISVTGFYDNFRVFSSEDGGDTWTDEDVSRDLKLPANAIVYQSGSNDRIFVGTDAGVYMKDNTMGNWVKYGDLPNVRVIEMKINACNGKLRVSTFGRGMWEVDLPPVNVLSLTKEVNANETWSTDIYLLENLVVKSGNTLTINNGSKLYMPAKSKIIIEPGAKILLTNATITNACGAIWRGIEVHGNYSQNQNATNQGMLIMNNSTIEYAEDAVMLWKIGDFNKSGGIVQAVNSTFRNNGRSVEFMAYPNFNSASYFEKCTFKVDNQFPSTHNFRAFVTMWNVKAVSFRGCEFDVQAPNLVFDDQHVFENRGYGILAYDANFTVTYHCPAGIDPCPAKQNGSFKNLKYAISAHSMEQDRPITVAYTDFKDNQWGIHNVGVNNAVLVRNNFELGKQWSTYSDGVNYMGPSEGISIYTGTGFRIEENNFNPSSEFTNIAVGIVVSAAGEADNQTFRNNFNGIQYGSISNYINRDLGGYTGLRFLCGNFDEVWFDNAVIPVKHPKYEGVRLHQLEGQEYVSGNEYSAGNNFTQNPIYPEGNYLNHTDNLIYYWWHQGSGYPQNRSVNRVSPTSSLYDDDCISNFNDGYTEERLDGTTELPVLIVQYGTLEAEYGNLLHNMHQLLDGGNTPSLLQTIYETWPQEAWDLRADLLANSPYLSQDALREAAHNENFPRAMLLEVLLANPDAHRNDHGFVDFLQHELQPALPAYMIDLVVLSWEDMTLRTVLEAKMAAKAGDMAWRLNQIVNYYLTDSINQDAQVEYWLNRALDLRSKYRLAWHHARKNQYSTALAVTSGLSTQFTLNQPQLAEKVRFESLIAFKQSLGTTGLAGVNGEGIGWLENFVASTDDAFDYSLALAQNALQHQGSMQIHQVHLPQSEPQGRRAANKEQALQQLREDLTVLKLYPNPANAYATLSFELPQEVEEATLVIADLTGKIVNRITLNGKKGQQLIDIRNLPAGMYITSVVCKSGILKREKIVINR